MDENEISRIIYHAAIEVHRALGGPGLLESIYEEALVCELEARGMTIRRQVLVPVQYKGKVLGAPLRVDLVVHHLVIVECKSTLEYNPVFEAQALTYLRLTGLRLALVINFGEPLVSKGIHRVVNGMPN